jgi:hypothetical protein
VAIAATPDQELVVGPPGTAQAAITARTPGIVPDCIAAWSIAASCAIAPSTVCGQPVATPAGPVSGHFGNTITGPGSLVDTGPGSAADPGAAGIGRVASSSRAA